MEAVETGNQHPLQWCYLPPVKIHIILCEKLEWSTFFPSSQGPRLVFNSSCSLSWKATFIGCSPGIIPAEFQGPWFLRPSLFLLELHLQALSYCETSEKSALLLGLFQLGALPSWFVQMTGGTNWCWVSMSLLCTPPPLFVWSWIQLLPESCPNERARFPLLSSCMLTKQNSNQW